MRLITLAQRRADNTGITHYVVTCATSGRLKVKMHPQRTMLVDDIHLEVTPNKHVRAVKLLRRKTRGGNRVRVGGNVR